MTHTFTLSKSEIIARVETEAAYIAVKTDKDYDTERIKKADSDMTNIFFDEACQRLEQLMLHFMAENQEETEADWSVTFDKVNYPERLTNILHGAMKVLVQKHLLMQWLNMVGDTDGVKPVIDAEALAEKHFRHLLLERTKPFQVVTQPM